MLTLSLDGFAPALAQVRNAPRQIKLASVRALNESVLVTQGAVVSVLLPSRFTLRARGRPWQKPGGPLGFNVRPFARMSQPEPFAVLGSRADWLGLQEEGGIKRSSTGKSLALPQPGTARPTESSVIARRSKPAALLARKGFFVAKARKGGHLILQRIGRGKEIRLWYGFERSTHIKPRLGFRAFVRPVVARTFHPAFSRHLRAALATARR